TRWYIKDKVKENFALEPDSIMLHDGKIYVLDAKYYRYGITGNPVHLPESSSINKQITYGEYIYTQERFKREYGKDVPVYNAFLMPYNSAKNVFGFDSIYGNIGEARGEWKSGNYDYERVQGIVVDIRYLMYHYTGSHSNKIIQLAEAIEKAIQDNKQTSSDV
ncbi:MAG: LlaJI family restriction endonuclease, partial [Oscillospiraceae bacterium]|nr:LlaJI family restriction endonuclease [Oscillospiraceae bacterium]